MWIVIVGAYAAFVACLTAVLAHVTLRKTTTPTIRRLAFRMFRIVWTAGVAGLCGGLLKLHDTGLL